MLTKNEQGDKEFLHSHAVLHYLPKQADYLWNKFQIGLGACSIQGIEKMNKESKNCCKRFTNNRRDPCTQMTNRLFDSFYLDKNSC